MSNRNLSNETKQRIIWSKGGRCWYCGRRYGDKDMYGKPHPLQVDHIVPVSRGGGDNDDNLVPCCRLCNREKGTLNLEEYRYQLFSETGMYFNPRQLEYLESLGIELPEPEPYEFWFEYIQKHPEENTP